ncbi:MULTISPECIES: NADPH-dependent FMN reductase [unclassified Streptomyces]|uniref:NADPH-dependent FMN reductase n=1 Tax=unclassified Streptomyces TaxID=2593676 RepID=UPI0008859EF1|nr:MULTISPECIES: NADPH-dependent FMN reductase [unclassified Streptomyces]PBC83831.1 NAD(P)H-dependent FMN reductase [Streptomyces sp. 2321.6]SDR38166.1 NAD(P)H-dependent FMN reductase [Streptomyces sp. KS_16]SED10430.1 NAD(P)H-dependent FMN reductase [Streptomyces sp. 2133.1]SNC69910.1 NAD(P)H-dependent FMN reductase [Streptomyces sp. 2114.4]
MRLLALSGSLRARSSNGAVLRSALAFWDGPTATADIGALPHFNPDLDGEDATPTAPVAALRAQVATADALLIVSPEYAHGVPGVLKNALDWLVSSGECVSKPVAVITASPSPTGGDHANAQLREILRMMTGEVIQAACREIPAISPKIDPTTERVTDEATLSELRAALSHLAAATGTAASEPESGPAATSEPAATPAAAPASTTAAPRPS